MLCSYASQRAKGNRPKHCKPRPATRRIYLEVIQHWSSWRSAIVHLGRHCSRFCPVRAGAISSASDSTVSIQGRSTFTGNSGLYGGEQYFDLLTSSGTAGGTTEGHDRSNDFVLLILRHKTARKRDNSTHRKPDPIIRRASQIVEMRG